MPDILDVLISPELPNEFSELTGEQLLHACADLRNSAAWDEFVQRFQRLIYTAVLRTLRRYGQFNSALCDDLVQDTYLRLSAHDAKALRDFVPRQPGSASNYVWVIAVRVTLDYCKSKKFLPGRGTSAGPARPFGARQGGMAGP